MTPSLRERIEGGLVGLLVGDALGVPYEFHRAEALPPVIEMTPPPGFARSYPSVPPGTWSDDGAQALCLLASLLDCGRLDPEDLGRKFVDWYTRGYWAVGGVVFDIGIQTRTALSAIRTGAPALQAGPSGERDNGNGSLMRVLPLALWHRGTDAELVADAHTQSRVTHGHPRSLVCCALYCLWARRLLEGAADPWAEAAAALRAIYPAGSPERAELEGHVRPDETHPGHGSGYVLDCLFSARAALQAGPYEAAVRAAVALGNDTDTTAAVTGGLAGVRDGIDAIPARWRDALRGRELLAPLLEALLAYRC